MFLCYGISLCVVVNMKGLVNIEPVKELFKKHHALRLFGTLHFAEVENNPFPQFWLVVREVVRVFNRHIASLIPFVHDPQPLHTYFLNLLTRVKV